MIIMLKAIIIALLASLAKQAYEIWSVHKDAVRANKTDEFWIDFLGLKGGEKG